jgi:hypothetical protein
MLRIDPDLDSYRLYPEWDASPEAERHRLMLRAEAKRRQAIRRERWQVLWTCLALGVICAVLIATGVWE